MNEEPENVERNLIPPVVGSILNDVSVVADHFEPDIETSEEV